MLKLRHDHALEATKFDHLVIFAGAQHVAIFDDYLYPFKVNPHFKWWVPVVDNPHCFIVYTPGQTPRLVYYQPVDYWYKPADTPERLVGRAVRHRDHPHARGSERSSSRRTGAWRSSASGTTAFKAGEGESSGTAQRASLRAAPGRPSTRSSASAPRTSPERAATSPPRKRSAPENRNSRFTSPTCARRCRPRKSCRTATSSRSMRTLPCCTTSTTSASSPGDLRYSFLIDAGASCNGYASDITRTYSEKKDEFRDLIDAMDAMQQSLCDDGEAQGQLSRPAHARAQRSRHDPSRLRLRARSRRRWHRREAHQLRLLPPRRRPLPRPAGSRRRRISTRIAPAASSPNRKAIPTCA